jgi:hypothetical protein
VVFELARGKRNGVKFSIFINLGEYGSKASWSVGGARGGIRDQGVLAVQSWKGHDWFGDELFSEVYEGGHGGFW